MSPYRPHTIFGIFLCCLFGIALLASEVIVGAHLVQVGVWRGFDLGQTPLIMLLLLYVATIFICAVLLIAAPLMLAKRARYLRAAIERNDHIAPPSAFQRDHTLALRDGESLRLARQRKLGDAFRSWLGIVVSLLGLTALVEACFWSLLPSFGHSSLNPLYDPLLNGSPSPPPSRLDWFVALWPPAMLCLSILPLAYGLYRQYREEVTADDNGVTIRRSGRHTVFLPWNGFSVFLRTSDSSASSSVGAYALWSNARGVWLRIHSRETVATVEGRGRYRRQRQARGYEYEGGYAAYSRDAERLLATISARSYLPLRVARDDDSRKQRIAKRASLRKVALMAIEQIQATPLAQPQPHPKSLEGSIREEPPGKVTLKERLPWAPVVAQSLVLSLVLIGLVTGFSVNAFRVPYPSSPAQQTRITEISYAIIGVFVLLAAISFVLERRRSRVPYITATTKGLLGYSPIGNRMTKMLWSEILGWVAIPPTSSARDTTGYIVFGAGFKRIVWQESPSSMLAGRGVRDDRRAAFRERADELNALILARTGLPLHEFTDERRVNSLGSASVGSSIEQ